MQLQQYIPLELIDAVVLSHYHWDHVADLGCLQYASRVLMDLGKRQKPLQIYGHAEDSHFTRLDYLDFAQGHVIDTRRQLNLGPLTFTFGRNIHPDTAFSMRIEQDQRVLAYVTDTEWRDDLIKIARRADLLICESSLYDEFIGKIPGHLTAGEAGRVAAEAGAKHLVLNHLPHYGDHHILLEQARQRFDGKIELAAAGKSWQL